MPPAKSDEAEGLGATGPQHRHCQTTPGTFQLQDCLVQPRYYATHIRASCGTLLQKRIVDLWLPHLVLHSQPRQRLQEGSGAETPPLPGPAGRTWSFPWCSRRKSEQSHANAFKKVTAPSGVAIDSAGCRSAGISPRAESVKKAAGEEEPAGGLDLLSQEGAPTSAISHSRERAGPQLPPPGSAGAQQSSHLLLARTPAGVLNQRRTGRGREGGGR
nr:uncharacterized protein LOC127315625 [Lolium perenne]